MSEATVARWMKQAGEYVTADEPLIELETDKVTLEVNAPVSGVLTVVTAAQGATVEVGHTLGSIDESAAATSAKAAPAASVAPASAITPASVVAPVVPPVILAAPTPALTSPSVVKLSPAVSKLVAEIKVSPSQVAAPVKRTFAQGRRYNI